MVSNLQIYTSFLSSENIERIVSNNLLPVFILRYIGNIECVSDWYGTPLHIPELSPSNELFWDYRDGKIDHKTYIKKFLIEICEVNFHKLIKKFEYLTESCQADGIVLCAIGNKETSHRTIVSDILWRTGYLIYKPTELYV